MWPVTRALLKRRPLGLVARATQPLAGADPAVAAFADFAERRARWLWFPLAPPDRSRPLPVSAHVYFAAVSLIGEAGAEGLLLRIGALPEGGRPWHRRALIAGYYALVWAWFTGAWERRARRCRWTPSRRR